MTEAGLAEVRIVLVEPAGPLNVGAIARVMKNMGLSQLILVNPQCDPLDADARKMAVHAADILSAAQQVDSLAAALTGCQRTIATTARSRTLETQLELPRHALPWLIEAEAMPLRSAVIFGPEDRGLSNQELNYAQRFVRIPSHPDYPSLNLAQAVAVCCYELYQFTLAPASSLELPSPALPLSAPTAPTEALEGYYQHLEALLLKIGYLYPHTAVARMEKFRRLFNRASLSAPEVAMLRGVLSQMEWVLQQSPD